MARASRLPSLLLASPRVAGPDNRASLYFGDSWKVRSNLTLALGLRWERDTGRTDSDLGAIPELNAAFPGFGNPVHQPNKNFAPQIGIAWDPKGSGKTVFRAALVSTTRT